MRTENFSFHLQEAPVHKAVGAISAWEADCMPYSAFKRNKGYVPNAWKYNKIYMDFHMIDSTHLKDLEAEIKHRKLN